MKETLTLLLTVWCLVQLWGQRTITGTITDDGDGLPLIGATVQLKANKAIGTITGIDGAFSLDIPDKAEMLTISFIGYTPKDIPIGNQSVFEVTLGLSATTLDAVVVVGYGTQIRSELTGNISSIDREHIESVPVNSIESVIQGRAAGVFVSAQNGKLGTNLDIRIRGNASINAANEPLFVIDGIVMNSQEQVNYSHPRLNPMADLNFNDVESIEILKDASASAIYGSRASNGVILITTRRGKAGKVKFDLDVSNGWSRPTRKRQWLNAAQYLELWEEAFSNVANPQGLVFGLTGKDWKDRVIPGWNGGHDVDWEDEMYNDDAGIRQVQLNISGGNEKTKFFVSGGWSDQTGIIIMNAFERFSTRLNLDHKASDKFDFGVNLSVARSKNKELTHDGDFANPGQMIALPPVQPLYDPEKPDELFPNTLYFNAKQYEQHTDWETVNFRTLGNAYLNWKPIQKLTFHSDFGLDLFLQDFERWYGSEVAANSGEPNGRKWNGVNLVVNYSTNNYLSLQHQMGSHQFLWTAGMSYQQTNEEGFGVQGRNFPNDDFQNLDSAGEIYWGVGGESDFSILSYFARLNYNYDQKFLLALSSRVDGDSRFGKDQRYGFFPAASAGWVLSREPFLQDSKILSFLKFRASWGQTGNTPLQRFAALGVYEGTRYAGISGIVPTRIANPDLRWEKTTQIDIGLDFGLFNDRISGQLDYYRKNTEDLLLNVNIAATSGFTSQLQNVGELFNEGVEAALSAHLLTGAFKWKTDINFARNVNEVTNLNGQVVEGGATNRAMEGQAAGVFFAPEYAGVDPDNGDALFYRNSVIPGSTSLDRSTTNNINEAERVVIGNPNPDFIYGIQNSFSWKGFELQVFLQGVHGNEIYNAAGIYQMDGFGWFDNQDIRMLERWQSPGDQTDIPQLRFRGTTENSSRFIEDGTYLRLKNLTFSYQLPTHIVRKIGLRQLRFYATGQNLATFTNYRGWDPEVNTDLSNFGNAGVRLGEDFFTLPQARTIVFGFKAGF